MGSVPNHPILKAVMDRIDSELQCQNAHLFRVLHLEQFGSFCTGQERQLVQKSVKQSVHARIVEQTGPGCLTRTLMQVHDLDRVLIVPQLLFYPKANTSTIVEYTQALAVHHWSTSWQNE